MILTFLMLMRLLTELPKAYVEVRNHPHDLVIGDINQGVQTRSKLNYMTQITFISLIELKNIKEACAGDFWTIAM